MKKHAVKIVLAMALMLVIVLAGTAFSEDATLNKRVQSETVAAPGQTTTAATGTCAATCPKFVDLNKDGVCDSMALHHVDGKCANMEQCKKDGKCPGNCKNHAEMMKTTKTATGTCDPTKCATMPNGCSKKAKSGCPGSK
jgi:hypothetical protein